MLTGNSAGRRIRPIDCPWTSFSGWVENNRSTALKRVSSRANLEEGTLKSDNTNTKSRQTAVKQGRAELARCYMLVLFLLVSGQLCSAPRCLSGHTNRNNTNIKHRSARPSFTAACLDAGSFVSRVEGLNILNSIAKYILLYQPLTAWSLFSAIFWGII